LLLAALPRLDWNEVMSSKLLKIHKNTSMILLRKQSGASLIEVLVSVLILSFGLLGMAALQTRALQGNQSSVQRSQAIMLNQYMMDAMRVDRENAKGSLYNTDYVCGPDGISGSDTLAKNNMRHWLDNIERGLGVPEDTTSCGAISCSASYVCTVKIKWDDSKSGGLTNQVVQLTSTL
jgi:type IV pilus assembly protein PilV